MEGPPTTNIGSKRQRLDPDIFHFGNIYSDEGLLNAPVSSSTSIGPILATGNSLSGAAHHSLTPALNTKPTQDGKLRQEICDHCGWNGKHILQHVRYNKSCMDKTDMDDLRKKVKEQNRLTKKLYDQEHYEKNKEKKTAYYEENQEKKRKYQTLYDNKNIDKKKAYYEENKEKKKEYQRKYDREHKEDGKQRNRFSKRYICNEHPEKKFGVKRDDPSLTGYDKFKTLATCHIYSHSSNGKCKLGSEIFHENCKYWDLKLRDVKLGLTDWEKREFTLIQRTITAHQIDRNVKEENCVNCNSQLIKLYNINRMQCHKCYSAKCFICKSTVNPNIDKAYEHFWVPKFNAFVPELCSYFENSQKHDIPHTDTCASCEASDKGSQQKIRDHYSEEANLFICNEKCPGEFSSICEALMHLSKKTLRI